VDDGGIFEELEVGVVVKVGIGFLFCCVVEFLLC
jgi:hypothetical protein